MLDAALSAYDLGLTVIPIKVGDKKPADAAWQKREYPRQELVTRFTNKPNLNLGLRLGDVIDIEGDEANSEADFAELFAGIEVPTSPSYQSRRSIHRLFQNDDRLRALNQAVLKFKSVEIRLGGGKGAQSLLPPSTTDGVTRTWIRPPGPEAPLPKLPDAVVSRLIAQTACSRKGDAKPLNKNNPGDDFCQRATWREILEPHGWTFLYESGGVENWRRPGKSEGLSATCGHCKSDAGRDLMYVFTSNAPPFEQGKSYSRFAAFTLLNHDNDYTVAADDLRTKGYGKAKSMKATTRVLSLLADAELFQSQAGEPFATVEFNGHRETMAIESKAFKRYVEHRYFKKTGGAIPNKSLTEALGVIAARARFEGATIPVHVRLAGYNDSIYLDLANDRWEAVEITARDWRVVSNPPVKFRRPSGVLPLPYPQEGAIDELRRVVNVDDDSWPLLVMGLAAALRPSGPYPIMLFNSEHGSGKSTTMRFCRRLIDPNTADLRSSPENVQSLMLAATNGWLPTLDNASAVGPWLSDAFCRLSTGGGLGTRLLYSDGEEKLFDCQRPLMITGIAELTTREDFLDRCVIIQCPTISKENRRAEKELHLEFEKARPRILGALLTAASAAIKNLPNVKLDELPRMADFAMWGTAAESAFGWAPGSFLAAYLRNRHEANAVALDTPVAQAVMRMLDPALFDAIQRVPGLTMEDGKVTWRGNAAPLLAVIKDRYATPEMLTSAEWPRGPSALSAKINRIQVNLREAGISAVQHRREWSIALSA